LQMCFAYELAAGRATMLACLRSQGWHHQHGAFNFQENWLQITLLAPSWTNKLVS
jgi:hypothetical protein